MVLRLTRLEFERLQARRKDRNKPPAHFSGSRWELELAAQLDAAGLSGRYQREYRFLQDRRFRFDFAFLPERLAVEVDGAVHRIKKRYQGDQEKGQLALLGAWRVLHVTPAQVRSEEALSIVKKLLEISSC